MKLRGELVCLTVLLVATIMVTPAIGSMNKAVYQNLATTNEETVTLDFVDCTHSVPIKKEITMPKSEWKSLNEELNAIATSGLSLKDTLTAQITLFQKHHLISPETNINAILSKLPEKTNTGKVKSLQDRIQRSPIFNNTLFSVLSAISFTLDNGTTLVLGLNSFINYVGFDIVSFHKGHASTGIQTTGVISKSVPPGNYAGFIFGFFGYWFGQKTSTAVYSSVTVAGLGIITLWVSID